MKIINKETKEAVNYLKELNRKEQKMKEKNHKLSSSEQKKWNAWKVIWEWKVKKPSLSEEFYWRVFFKLDEAYSRIISDV